MAAIRAVPRPSGDAAPPPRPPADRADSRRASRRRAPRTRRGRCATLRLARQGKRAIAGQAGRERPARGPAPRARRRTRRILVLFGATGDLAHRKVLPALYQLWRTNLLPHEFLVARGRPPRRTTTRRSGPRSGPRSSSSAGSCRSTRPPGGRSPSGSATTGATSPTTAASTRLATRLDEIDAEHGHPRQPALLPRDPAVAVRRDRRPARPGRARPRAPRRRLAADRHREAVRPRPRLGEAAQPRGRQGLPRVAGLPHRPLPGQGDRPEPAGLPVRQRHLRAALEPALRRPRADHRGRVDRRRGPRRVLRGDRRVARRPPEPPAPAAQPRRDGAAGDVRGGRPARREGQGPARDRRWTRRGREPTSSAASTARAGSPRPRSRATARSRRSIPQSETETFVAARLEIDDWRWSGVPFYLRTGKRLPKRATEIAIQFREVPHRLFRDAGGRPGAEPARHPHPAGRGDPAALRGQGARASGSTSAR